MALLMFFLCPFMFFNRRDKLHLFYFKEGELLVPKGEVERAVIFGFIAGTSISIYVFVVSLFKKSEKQ